MQRFFAGSGMECRALNVGKNELESVYCLASTAELSSHQPSILSRPGAALKGAMQFIASSLAYHHSYSYERQKASFQLCS